MAKSTVKIKLFTEYNDGEDMMDLDFIEVEVSKKQLDLLKEIEEKLNEQNDRLREDGTFKQNDGVWMSVEDDEYY